MMSFGSDLGYGLRGALRNPGFAVAAILSIGLGIAANTTVFSIVNAALYGHLPVQEPERLVSIQNDRRAGTLSWPEYEAFRDDTKDVFDGVSALFPVVAASLAPPGAEPERIWGQIVTGNFFDVVRAPFAVGRGFASGEDAIADPQQVAVLSWGLWQRRFAGDPLIAGKTITMNGRKFTVAGVVTRGFRGTQRGLLADFWVPMALGPQFLPGMNIPKLRHDDHAQWILIDGRLRPGVSRQQAIAALNVVHRRIEVKARPKDPPTQMILEDAGGLPGGTTRFVRPALYAVMGVVSLVLLIACANVANLMLARAMARQREIGIRIAIGASRARVIRQLLTETMALTVAGGVVGLFLASVAARAIETFKLPLPVPLAIELSPDWRVIGFTLLLAFIAAVLCGLVPALRASRTSVSTVIRSETQSFGSLRKFSLRHALVMAQVALSCFLLVAAGLFLRSLSQASNADLGMKTDRVLVLAVDTTLHGYTHEQTMAFLDSLRQRMQAQPGIEAMSYTDVVPLSIGGVVMNFSASRKGSPDHTVYPDVFTVGDEYFSTMGIPLRQGRDFRRDVTAGPRVAVVNEEMARRLFGAASPLGRTIWRDDEEYQIIGVSGNTQTQRISETPNPAIYRSRRQIAGAADSFFGTALLVRTSGAPLAAAGPLREAIRALDANLPVFNIETMKEHANKALLLPQLLGILFGLFGGCGLLLATIGLYGVMSYISRQRTREIGIRIALGADRSSLLRTVSTQGLTVSMAGIGIGLAGAAALSRVAASVLFGVRPLDGLTFGAVALILALVSLAAVMIPARRASRIEPMQALRHD